jgi:NAD(P)-dependent dehydrogenase (short-subunit alcohol dehydrogenase family)
MNKRVVLMTGASRGLGRVMALALIRAGHNVIISAEDGEALDAAANALSSGPGRATAIVADLADTRQAEHLADEAVNCFGRVDMLVNNAGINLHGVAVESVRRQFWRSDRETVERLFAVNTVSAILLANKLAPAMIERGWGRIVAITTSLDTMLRLPLYGASKAAAEAQAAFMAWGLEGTGVTVNVLVPGGAAATRMAEYTGMEGVKLIPAEVMGEPIIFLASDESNTFSARRIIAARWKSNLLPASAAHAASDPIAWSGMGAEAIVLK